MYRLTVERKKKKDFNSEETSASTRLRKRGHPLDQLGFERTGKRRQQTPFK